MAQQPCHAALIENGYVQTDPRAVCLPLWTLEVLVSGRSCLWSEHNLLPVRRKWFVRLGTFVEPLDGDGRYAGKGIK